MKFIMGQLFMTCGVNDLVASDNMFAEYVQQALRRHACADWGDVCDEDWGCNDQALLHDERLLSVYASDSLPTIWIVTEWDRSMTTILFPSEY